MIFESDPKACIVVYYGIPKPNSPNDDIVGLENAKEISQEEFETSDRPKFAKYYAGMDKYEYFVL